MFKTLLVPVDLGEVEAAQPAIDKAVELAKSADGTLRLVYVRPIVPVTYMEFMPPAFDEEQQGEARQGLRSLPPASISRPSPCLPWCALARSTVRFWMRPKRPGLTSW
jgi:nucleotide-binding universal stress UspA family protein